MTEYLLALRFALLNLAGCAAFGAALAYGLPQHALAADATGLTALIGAAFLFGLAIAAGKTWQVSRELNGLRADGTLPAWTWHQEGQTVYVEVAEEDAKLFLAHRIAIVRHIANLLVVLGLIGTVLGFIIALGGVDPTKAADVTAIGPMVSTLIAGMSTALYTTLVGAIANVWLMANYNLLAGGCVKLLRALRRA